MRMEGRTYKAVRSRGKGFKAKGRKGKVKVKAVPRTTKIQTASRKAVDMDDHLRTKAKIKNESVIRKIYNVNVVFNRNDNERTYRQS